MKTYYSDYVSHILRFYIRHKQKQTFANACELSDFKAAENVFKQLPPSEQHVIDCLYRVDYNTFTEAILTVVDETKERDYDVWEILRRTQRAIAKERGLIS